MNGMLTAEGGSVRMNEKGHFPRKESNPMQYLIEMISSNVIEN